MDGQFKIKSYGYGELALLYFHNSTKKSASTQLGRWIRQNAELKKELTKSGFKSGRRILTPKQVRTIIDFLGEP